MEYVVSKAFSVAYQDTDYTKVRAHKAIAGIPIPTFKAEVPAPTVEAGIQKLAYEEPEESKVPVGEVPQPATPELPSQDFKEPFMAKVLDFFKGVGSFISKAGRIPKPSVPLPKPKPQVHKASTKKVSKVRLPKINIPKITLPKLSLPKLTIPKIAMPKLSLPKLKLPALKLPTLKLPTIKAKPRVKHARMLKLAKEKPLKASKNVRITPGISVISSALKSKNPLKLLVAVPKALKYYLIDEPRKLVVQPATPKPVIKLKAEKPLKPAGEKLKLFARLNLFRFLKRAGKPSAKPEPVSALSSFDKLRVKLGGGRTPKAREIIAMETRQAEEKPLKRGKQVILRWNLGASIIQKLRQRFSKEEPVPILAAETLIPEHVKKLEEMRSKIYAEEKSQRYTGPSLLEEQAKSVRRILEAEQPEGYKGTFIGQLANLTVKRYSLRLINNNPEIFGKLYNNLRAANVKMLSNTYVNIMILVTLGSLVGISILSVISLFILNFELWKVIVYSLGYGLLASIISIAFFFMYPTTRIGARRRDILTNLPFALNHLSSVSASGVPPAKMFELLAESDEYGEVSIEMKKIVDFVNIFGYDILTAVKSVAVTTPSQPFKEFLQGLVATVETGGDLTSYLQQKAEEASLKYQLERQKYTETVSTYSDIYTGVLIAAPLFFIAALALVNLLGGTIGGFGVDFLMAMGAYVVIPFLNIAFIMFLQVNQPEV